MNGTLAQQYAAGNRPPAEPELVVEQGNQPVRVGKIKGRLAGQQLKIEWDGAPAEIGYKRYLLYPTRKLVHGEKSHPAYSPWLASAQVTSSGNGHFEEIGRAHV